MGELREKTQDGDFPETPDRRATCMPCYGGGWILPRSTQCATALEIPIFFLLVLGLKMSKVVIFKVKLNMFFTC